MEAIPVKSPFLTSKARSWASLPVEVRQMILRLVGLPSSGRQYSGLGSPKVAPFATVCREWQVFFETCTFRRLCLDPDSLGDFDAIVRKHDTRLGHIRKIWLRVKLLKYECPHCDEAEDEATQRRNNTIFTTCIRSLLRTLALWDPVRHGAEGLVLMLSASSPSDTEHRFNFCEIRDDYPFHYTEDLNLASGMVNYHRMNMVDPFGSYFHCGRPPPWHGQHLQRLQGTPLCLEPSRGERGRFISKDKSIPTVPIVKGLVIRRQFRRDIHIRTLSRLFRRSFVALEWFHFERTISPEPHQQTSFDRDFQLYLLPSLPKTLRQLSFTQFEIPNVERDHFIEQLGSTTSPYTRTYLPQEMAKLSQRLEKFCPPWHMDTAAFLQSIFKLRESPKILQSSLKRIILRCLLSNSERSGQIFGSLVLLAAKAAILLPQLEVMELWGTCLDGQESRAYIFRYCCEEGRASVVWRSCNETMVAQALMIAKWSEVARRHSHPTLTYNVVPFAETKAEIFKSDGTCIYRHLLLKNLMFDPITQIILENEPYQWSLGQESDASEHGSAQNSNLSNPSLLVGNLLTNILGYDADLASLQADVIALDAEINDFIQEIHK